MAETTLFQTLDDEIKLIETVLSLGLAIVPDLEYPSPKYEILGSMKGYLKVRDETVSHFFLISERFLQIPAGYQKA